MKIFRFDPEVGRRVDQYDSSGFIISKVAHLSDEAVVHCAFIEASGRIGYHQATLPQLFLVVGGEGWVRAESSDRVSIKAGQAAYWEVGEWHESGTEAGMTAIIIEGHKLDPAELMPPV